ncbi:hypothetical protein BK010_02825 [Tenericutes bacterium MO-XQ]|nr:hypothetical protein BK010_02825 [Tenericutes bacterium MO-XQ]
MKNLNHTLQLDHLYIYGIGLFIAVFGLFHPWAFLGLFVYMYKLRKRINMLFFCVLFLLIYLPFLLTMKKGDQNIDEILMVTDIEHKENYQRLTLKHGYKKYHLYLYDNLYQIGDRLWIKGDLIEYKSKTSTYGFDAKMYFLGHGIYAKIESTDVTYVDHQFHPNSIREALMSKSQDDINSSYIHAFIFGEKISDDHVKSIYEEFNIVYLFTISGMHIYMLITLFKKILFHLNFRLYAQHLFIISILIGLCFLNQFHYGVLRVLFIYVITILNKRYKLYLERIDMIFIAFYIMLIINIHYIYHQGFLMTFLILITIELLHPLYQSLNVLLKSLFISFVISVMMIPFLSRIDLLVVMCLPIIISIVIYLLYPLAILGSISKNFLYVFNIIIEFFEKIIGLLSIKQITFYIPKFNVYITLLFYGLLIWICFGKSKHRVIKRIFISAFCFFLVMMIQLKTYQERIVFLDVGQGDTTIIQVDNCNMVIDSFEGTLDYLVDHGMFHLDYLILTHSDQDHILEAVDITKSIDVKELILSAYDDNYPMFNQKAMSVKAYDKFKCGTIDLNILGPIRKYDLDNNNSIVLKFTYDQKVFLFAGDIEKEAEIDLINSYHHTLKSDILKVPHHGSITSSSESFLTYVNPAYAIISLKTPNRYGFPSQDVLLRYIKNQTIIYRTDQQGTITYHGKRRKEKWSSYLSI